MVYKGRSSIATKLDLIRSEDKNQDSKWEYFLHLLTEILNPVPSTPKVSQHKRSSSKVPGKNGRKDFKKEPKDTKKEGTTTLPAAEDRVFAVISDIVIYLDIHFSEHHIKQIADGFIMGFRKGVTNVTDFLVLIFREIFEVLQSEDSKMKFLKKEMKFLEPFLSLDVLVKYIGLFGRDTTKYMTELLHEKDIINRSISESDINPLDNTSKYKHRIGMDLPRFLDLMIYEAMDRPDDIKNQQKTLLLESTNEPWKVPKDGVLTFVFVDSEAFQSNKLLAGE